MSSEEICLSPLKQLNLVHRSIPQILCIEYVSFHKRDRGGDCGDYWNVFGGSCGSPGNLINGCHYRGAFTTNSLNRFKSIPFTQKHSPRPDDGSARGGAFPRLSLYCGYFTNLLRATPRALLWLEVPVFYLLFVDMRHSHVHRVDCGKDIGGTLDNAFPCLRHCDGGARGHEYRFVAAAQRQVREVMTLD